MVALHPLLASSYINIPDRGRDLVVVREELVKVCNAVPTQINPTERERYLDALLSDLEDRDGASWTSWPDDVYLPALTAVKSLGRNPIGSETLLSTSHLAIVLYHSSLPFPASDQLTVYPPPPPSSPQALEALRILANLLVLQEAGRKRFANAGGALAIARALARKAANEDICEHAEDVDRVFLLGRIGFLVTVDRAQAVEDMVDKDDLVNSLIYHLTTLPPIQANFAALSELMKLVNNILRYYPYDSASSDQEPWYERFDPLLESTLVLLYQIPFTDLSPPLTHTLHVLLSIPFLPRLLPIWDSVPDIPSISTPSSSVRTLFNKIGGMSKRKASSDQTSGSYAERTRSPTPSSSPQLNGNGGRRSIDPAPRRTDPTALPIRVMKILEEFFVTHLPYPKKSDDDLPPGLMLDEKLPPVLFFLSRAAVGSEPMRVCLKDTLLPFNLDRSPDAGPLESRKGLLGDLLRLMACSHHLQARDTAGELLWAICNGDVSTLSVEIGYGNAAGLLFRKGVSGPPPARIEEIDDTPVPSIFSKRQIAAVQPDERHPITSLRSTNDTTSAADEMTEEEKEREAERLFVLFERMEKNPIISASSGIGERQGIKEVMREKMVNGKGDEWDEEERRRMEEENRRDEDEARKEMEAYRRRVGRM